MESAMKSETPQEARERLKALTATERDGFAAASEGQLVIQHDEASLARAEAIDSADEAQMEVDEQRRSAIAQADADANERVEGEVRRQQNRSAKSSRSAKAAKAPAPARSAKARRSGVSAGKAAKAPKGPSSNGDKGPGSSLQV